MSLPGHELLGRGAEGIACLRRAIALSPSVPAYYLALWLETQSSAELQWSVVLAPDNVSLRTQAGNSLNRSGRVADAYRHFRVTAILDPSQSFAYNNIATTSPEADAESYRRALIIDPANAISHHGLSTVLESRGGPEEALLELRRAIALAPDMTEAYNNVASCRERQGRLEEARTVGRTALRLNPVDGMLQANQAVYLEKLEDQEGALRHFRLSLALEPASSGTYQLLALNLLRWGESGEAKSLLDRAISCDPNNAAAFRHRLYLEEFGPAEMHAALLGLLERAGQLPIEPRIDLHFAAGKAFAEAGKRGAAIEQWIAANQLLKLTTPYDEEAAFRRFDELKKTAVRKAENPVSDIPVFIVGMPRCGSSLVEQIIASHPDAVGAGEIADLSDLVEKYGLESPDIIGRTYLRQVTGRHPKAKRIVDKMLPHFLLVGLIHRALPQARIVHVWRNPIDSCMSNFSNRFIAPHPYSHDLAELGRYYRGYWDLMAHWRAMLPESTLLDVHYEELVADFDGQAPRILDFLGLPWDERCRSFHTTERRVMTASQTQVRRPLYTSSVGRWHAYRPYIAPLIEALGPLAEDV